MKDHHGLSLSPKSSDSKQTITQRPSNYKLPKSMSQKTIPHLPIPTLYSKVIMMMRHSSMIPTDTDIIIPLRKLLDQLSRHRQSRSMPPLVPPPEIVIIFREIHPLIRSPFALPHPVLNPPNANSCVN